MGAGNSSANPLNIEMRREYIRAHGCKSLNLVANCFLLITLRFFAVDAGWFSAGDFDKSGHGIKTVPWRGFVRAGNSPQRWCYFPQSD